MGDRELEDETQSCVFGCLRGGGAGDENGRMSCVLVLLHGVVQRAHRIHCASVSALVAREVGEALIS